MFLKCYILPSHDAASLPCFSARFSLDHHPNLSVVAIVATPSVCRHSSRASRFCRSNSPSDVSAVPTRLVRVVTYLVSSATLEVAVSAFADDLPSSEVAANTFALHNSTSFSNWSTFSNPEFVARNLMNSDAMAG